MAARRRSFSIPTAFLLIVVACLLLYPLSRTLARLFWIEGSFGFKAFIDAARLPGLVEVIWNTAFVVGVGGALAFLIATFLAWLNERTDASMGMLTDLIPALPFMVPPVAMAIGAVVLFAPSAGLVNVVLRGILDMKGVPGPINIYSMPGLVALYTIELVPYAYLVIASALRNIDPSMEEASRISGANELRTMWKVTLPAVKPALVSAVLLIVVMGFSLFSAAAIIGVPARIGILSSVIVSQVHGIYPPRIDTAVALSMLIVLVIAACWWVQTAVLRSGHFATVGSKSGRAKRIQLRGWKLPARIGIMLYGVCTVALPLLALLYISFQGYWSGKLSLEGWTWDSYLEIFGRSRESLLAVRNSLLLGVGGATICTAIVLWAAILLRQRDAMANRFVDAMLKLPGAISHLVLALALVVAYGGPPFNFGGTMAIVLIAYVAMYLPQASVAAGSSVSQVGRELEEASHISGANNWTTFRYVSGPLMLPGVLAGWALVFALMAGDLTASAILASPKAPVMGYMILSMYQHGTLPGIAAVAIVLTLVTAAVVVTALVLSRGKAPIGLAQAPRPRAVQ